MADDPSQPSAIKQIELLQQQLSDIKAELHTANEQLKKSKQEAAEKANAALKISVMWRLKHKVTLINTGVLLSS